MVGHMKYANMVYLVEKLETELFPEFMAKGIPARIRDLSWFFFWGPKANYTTVRQAQGLSHIFIGQILSVHPFA